MKVVAVIAEYNPFHNGHLYQLNCIREKYNADRIIVIMSGDFCQRGIPALFDKYTRAKMALENGADLVFELPVYFALGSAEYFARGAISLIDKIGVVDEINFGSEEPNINRLIECATQLSEEDTVYKDTLRSLLKQGMNYPMARSIALDTGNTAPKSRDKIHASNPADTLLAQPNNILAVEYIRALLQRNRLYHLSEPSDGKIKVSNIKRLGEGYNSDMLVKGSFASAAAIRKSLLSLSLDGKEDYPEIKDYVPEAVSEYICSALCDRIGYKKSAIRSFMSAEDFAGLIRYKLIMCTKYPSPGKSEALAEYYDMNEQLANRFMKHIVDFGSVNDFIMACKSKNITYTRLSRCLFHILLDMKQSTAEELKENDYCRYARLLGFNRNGQELLKSIKANSSIPIITRLSRAAEMLDSAALSSLNADLYASTLYQSVKNPGCTFRNEFHQKIIQVP